MALAMLLKASAEETSIAIQQRLNGLEQSKLTEEKMTGGSMPQPQSAFLGPQLWQEAIPPNKTDATLEFMDLDEFLEETGINLDEPTNPLDNLLGRGNLGNHGNQLSPGNHGNPESPGSSGSGQSWAGSLSPIMSPGYSRAGNHGNSGSNHMGNHGNLPWDVSPRHSATCTVTKRSLGGGKGTETSIPSPLSPDTPTDAADALRQLDEENGEDFDPSKRKFTADELRPLPIMKKSKKRFVSDANKDEKYWARRVKNNTAAKRSRDARRTKENQIAMRTAFLEEQNQKLEDELAESRRQTRELKRRLSQYEGDETS